MIFRFSEVLLDLPLVGIEAVLSSDELRVESEDAVYDFVISWARKHYPNPEKRREILGSKICQLIRFPNMSNHKLKDVISCDDLNYVCASKAVSEALLLKVEAPHKILNERAYRHLPVTVMEFDGQIRECMVFWSITKDSWSQLSPGDRLYSRPFLFSGIKFQLSAAVMLVESDQFLSVLVNVIDGEEGEIYNFDEIHSEYGARMQPSCEFQAISKSIFPAMANFIREGFDEYIRLSSNGENSEYLINNMIYVRFVVKLL